MQNDTLILADGTKKHVSPKNGTDYELEELQEFVGGLIEIVSSPDGEQIMVINEEGLLLDLDIIIEASRLYYSWHKGYPIVGNVLVTSTDKVK